jgi:hypothetical protein
LCGVPVDMNVPYSYGDNNLSAETIVKTVGLGIGAVECRTQSIEQYMGSPAAGKTNQPGRSRLPPRSIFQ